MLSIIFFILAGIANAVMDKIVFHWDRSIFKETKFEQWANPKVSYMNKWKNNSNNLEGEKFFGSSTIFVWTTDLWHFSQSFMITFFVLGVLSYDGIVNIGDLYILNLIIDYVILKMAFSIAFEIFWSKILEK